MFEVGQMVRVIDDHDRSYVGMTGQIVAIQQGLLGKRGILPILVEFHKIRNDQFVDRWCRYYRERDLECWQPSSSSASSS